MAYAQNMRSNLGYLYSLFFVKWNLQQLELSLKLNNTPYNHHHSPPQFLAKELLLVTESCFHQAFSKTLFVYFSIFWEFECNTNSDWLNRMV